VLSHTFKPVRMAELLWEKMMRGRVAIENRPQKGRKNWWKNTRKKGRIKGQINGVLGVLQKRKMKKGGKKVGQKLMIGVMYDCACIARVLYTYCIQPFFRLFPPVFFLTFFPAFFWSLSAQFFPPLSAHYFVDDKLIRFYDERSSVDRLTIVKRSSSDGDLINAYVYTTGYIHCIRDILYTSMLTLF